MKKTLIVLAVFGYAALIVCLWNQQKLENIAVNTNCQKPKFIRDADPSWTTVHFDGFIVDIPYSSEWRVESPWCLWEGAHYDPQIYSVVELDLGQGMKKKEIAFGRPTNNITSISSEYHLSRRSLASSFNPGIPTSWSCLDADIETPMHLTVEGVAGTRYFQGGTKWCEIMFQFSKDGYEYTLRRDLEPSMSNGLADNELAEIDEEMKRIITSVHGE